MYIYIYIYIYRYLSEFAKRWLLEFSLEHGHSPCSSHCGLSKLRGLAVKACFAKQPRDSSNYELCVKSTGLGGGGCCFETLTAVRVCGLVKSDFTL